MESAGNHPGALTYLWRRPLVRDIALVLCIKLLLLLGIRIAWFSERPADDLDPRAVAAMLLSSPSSAERDFSPHHPTQRDQP
nr:hypothetical protein [Gammaproteobacteria bacterium]